MAAVETARALRQRDDVYVIGVSALHRREPPADIAPPIPVRRLPLPRLALYESWHRFRRPEVQRATGPVDVIHATSIAIPPKSAPLVVTLHDLLWLRQPGSFTARGRSFFDRGLELARQDADLIICPSEATMADCAAAGLARDRLRLIPMGVRAADDDATRAAEVRRRYGLNRPYILWTGTIEPRKNLRGLLYAYATLDTDRDLVLIGPHGWREDIKGVLARLGGRAHALGKVPGDDLGPLYAGADVFCFPSFHEGFGLPVLEAMARGVPVVTSRGTSTEEVAGDAAVLVDPADPADIARGLAEVLGDPHRARSLNAAGRARAADFPWSRTAELTAAVYRELVPLAG